MSNKPSRRPAIKNIFTGSAALAAGASLSSFSSDMKPSNPPLKGNINHSAKALLDHGSDTRLAE